MADVSKVSINGTTYNIKDTTARTTANGKLSDAPSDGSEYVRKDGAWAVASGGGGGNIRYYVNVSVHPALEAEMARIENSSITVDTVVLECDFINSEYVHDRIKWDSYAGYLTLTGTCTTATTADIVVAEKSN